MLQRANTDIGILRKSEGFSLPHVCLIHMWSGSGAVCMQPPLQCRYVNYTTATLQWSCGGVNIMPEVACEQEQGNCIIIPSLDMQSDMQCKLIAPCCKRLLACSSWPLRSAGQDTGPGALQAGMSLLPCSPTGHIMLWHRCSAWDGRRISSLRMWIAYITRQGRKKL